MSDVPTGPLDVRSALDAAAARTPEAVALVGASGRYSFEELRREAFRAANALAALGVRPGDRVAASLPNDVPLVIAMLGTYCLGAVWVGVHRVLAAPEILHMLNDSGARLLLAEDAVVERLDGRELPATLRRVVRCTPDAASDDWMRCVAAADATPPLHDVDPHAPAAIAYTSGTTGQPKGAVHSQHNVLVPGAVSVARGSFESHEPIGTMLPMTILNMMVLGPLTSIQVGSKLVAIDRRDPVGIASWIREEGVAVFSTVPTAIYDLLTHPDVKPEDLASITKPRLGGSNSPEWFRELFRERFGAELSTSYGLTEAPTLVTREDPGELRVEGSLGVSLPHVEVSIRDPEGRALPVGKVGEICVGPRESGPWAGFYTPMLGYWGNQPATTEALRDGRLHTGDLGRLDAAGRLFLVERRSQLIIRGGSNIYPSEIERVLRRDARIADCVVVARPDDRLGEVPVAFIEVARGERLETAELRELCEQSLARYKIPDAFHQLSELPRGAMGKVQRHVLADRVRS